MDFLYDFVVEGHSNNWALVGVFHPLGKSKGNVGIRQRKMYTCRNENVRTSQDMTQETRLCRR